jgi:hypothetical protein
VHGLPVEPVEELLDSPVVVVLTVTAQTAATPTVVGSRVRGAL